MDLRTPVVRLSIILADRLQAEARVHWDRDQLDGLDRWVSVVENLLDPHVTDDWITWAAPLLPRRAARAAGTVPDQRDMQTEQPLLRVPTGGGPDYDAQERGSRITAFVEDEDVPAKGSHSEEDELMRGGDAEVHGTATADDMSLDGRSVDDDSDVPMDHSSCDELGEHAGGNVEVDSAPGPSSDGAPGAHSLFEDHAEQGVDDGGNHISRRASDAGCGESEESLRCDISDVEVVGVKWGRVGSLVPEPESLPPGAVLVRVLTIDRGSFDHCTGLRVVRAVFLLQDPFRLLPHAWRGNMR